MKTKAVRLYGKNDLRLESFELPKIKDDEILFSVITDSLCMSTWKLAKQGSEHKKAPNDLSKNPVIVGHEFCGQIIEIGKTWEKQFKINEKCVVQANLQLPNSVNCPGYSYSFTGGDATYIILPKEIMEQGCLLPYNGDTYFEGALIEPLSCVIGAFKANFHLKKGSYQHNMGIKKDGNLLIMGGTGPMGILSIDYALHGPIQPKNIVVTYTNEEKAQRIKKLYTSQNGVTIHYLNVSDLLDQKQSLSNIINGGYDDVFIMVAQKEMVNIGSSVLNHDGCLNFFAGPQDKGFEASINLYDLHYQFTHYVGTSGGNTEDMKEAIELIEQKKVNVANVVTHILGLNAVADTTIRQPEINGGKKLVYTQLEMDLLELQKTDENSELGKIIKKHEGVWSEEAEKYILTHMAPI